MPKLSTPGLIKRGYFKPIDDPVQHIMAINLVIAIFEDNKTPAFPEKLDLQSTLDNAKLLKKLAAQGIVQMKDSNDNTIDESPGDMAQEFINRMQYQLGDMYQVKIGDEFSGTIAEYYSDVRTKGHPYCIWIVHKTGPAINKANLTLKSALTMLGFDVEAYEKLPAVGKK